jgi:hypothetical protein
MLQAFAAIDLQVNKNKQMTKATVWSIWVVTDTTTSILTAVTSPH